MNSGNNGSCSVASLICSIVSFFVFPYIFGLAGIILGIIGVSKQEKTGLAIIGIILSIIGIIWALSYYGMI